jgi:predicted deacylase
MKNEISIGTIRARSGEKISGSLPVGDKPASSYSLPLTVINGASDGPILTIISGQHGTEYVGIASATELIRKINPAELSGALLIVPVVNVAGFEQRTRLAFPIEDDFSGTRNLNRIWPGDPNGSLAHVSLYALFNEVVKKGRYLLDLHGGDIYENLNPCTMITKIGKPEIDSATLGLAEAIGYDYVIESTSWQNERGRSKSEAVLSGIASVVIEAGDQGKLDEKLVEKMVSGVMRALKHLKMIEGSVALKKDYRVVYDMVKVKAKTGGLFHQSVLVGSIVKKGDKLGEIVSIDGSRVENVLAVESGLLIESFCNPAVNTGETLAEVALLR